MSGMYNMVFGVNHFAPVILDALEVDLPDFGRFRDAFVANGEIAVYTRCGGNNRSEFKYVFDRMRHHPNYLRDADDKFDSTYATFFFSIPEQHPELRALDIGKPFDPDARWREALGRVRGAR